jgi:hypothetical protein
MIAQSNQVQFHLGGLVIWARLRDRFAAYADRPTSSGLAPVAAIGDRRRGYRGYLPEDCSGESRCKRPTSPFLR